MITLIIVRHGESVSNRQNLPKGSDSDLTERGKEQAQLTAQALKNEPIEAVFSSPLKRAMQTADIIAKPHNHTPIRADELGELNWGDFANIEPEELSLKWLALLQQELAKGVKREEIRPPNGENSYDHAKRISLFLSGIMRKYAGKTVLLVAHAGTNKTIIGSLRHMDAEKVYDIPQDNGCINKIILGDKEEIITEHINVIEHLKQ